MNLTKHHGFGNDFLVALESRNERLGAPRPSWVREVCARRTGVGADGLILGLAPRNPTSAELRMELYNADGSTAEISGNGVRCLVQAFTREDEHRRERDVRVETDAGLRTVHVRPSADGACDLIAVDMGPVGDGPEVPAGVAEWDARRVGTFTIGNPHLVLLVDDLARFDPSRDGPALASMFDGGINVHAIAPAPDGIAIRHYERGAGVTSGCGSGASVAAAAAIEWGVAPEPSMTVHMPGGAATVTVGGTVRLEGPVVFVAEVVTP